ncbi:MAG TPA: hypothetical protein VHM31_08840 [Polyangia bacterium]|nr:hypothetical protein [Polyangia bacterium]
MACLLVVGCGGSGKVVTGPTGTAGAAGVAGVGGAGGAGFVEMTFPARTNNNLDLLFVIKNASSAVQQKLVAQLPTLTQVLQNLPSGPPNLHVAVVSTDMGAPSDVPELCSAKGDDGQFHAEPRGACTATTLAAGATFISDVDGQKNFTDSLEKVLQCIVPIGVSGCGIASPLAAIERALGADGQAPPLGNTGFLRPDAYLGIVIVTSEDDCSAPPDTKLYSLNGGPQSTANPLGPVAKYRCNQFGHLCRDSSGTTVMPPLAAPAAAGSPAIVNLTSCTSNETSSGLLTPVSTFVQHIRALKAEPDNQIVVAAITAPPEPYAVEWVPSASAPPEASGELWPQVMHSCGVRGGDDVNPNVTQSTVDGTFGDPGVRIAQFVRGFANSIVGSVCDPSYGNTMTAVATKVGGLIRGPCIVGHIQASPAGQPACTVTNHTTDGSGKTADTDVPNCILNGNRPPCWTLVTDPTRCPIGGTSFRLTTSGAVPSGVDLSTTVKCALCPDGSTSPGC